MRIPGVPLPVSPVHPTLTQLNLVLASRVLLLTEHTYNMGDIGARGWNTDRLAPYGYPIGRIGRDTGPRRRVTGLTQLTGHGIRASTIIGLTELSNSYFVDYQSFMYFYKCIHLQLEKRLKNV